MTLKTGVGARCGSFVLNIFDAIIVAPGGGGSRKNI